MGQQPPAAASGAQGVQFGDDNLQVNLFLQGSAAHSPYLSQVRRIAPAELLDRAAELDELARWCVTEGAGPYTRWTGDAWAGKSALMSWFVLHPPAGVRVVSFFVTARFAAQSDRVAFTEVVSEQFAEILRRPLPASSRSGLDARFLDLLEAAAAQCRGGGERLVLVVDGLDEDRGVTADEESYSIAALLPAAPPAGMRIIVAGRPHPPVPADVGDDHPLRDDAIVRPLGVSPHAEIVRVEAERDLKRLQRGTPLQRDLLGLVAAARGLSAEELIELTGEPPGDVRDLLGSSSGRVFTARPGWGSPGAGPDVYLLAHEGLYQLAVSRFGNHLDGYRLRLHRWADRYRDEGWPDTTPDYLLDGYTQMLLAAGDGARVLPLVTDAVRQDRLYARTGGDSHALAELNAAASSATGPAEAGSLLRLTICRDHLQLRNSRVPAGLPAAWAAIGEPGRAVTSAASLPEAADRAAAFTDLIPLLAGRVPAGAVAGAAESAAEEIHDVDLRARALGRLAVAVAATDPSAAISLARRAEAGAGGTLRSFPRAGGLLSAAEAAALAGDTGRARAIVARALDVHARATEARTGDWLAKRIARVYVALDDRASALTLVCTIEHDDRRLTALAAVLRAAHRADDRAVFEAALDAGRAIVRADAFEDAARVTAAEFLTAMAQCGAAASVAPLLEALRAAVRGAERAWDRGRGFAALAGAAAAAGDPAATESLVDEAGTAAAATAVTDRAELLKRLLIAVAPAAPPAVVARVTKAAIDAADADSDHYWHARSLTEIAGALARVDPPAAAAFARRAEAAARRTVGVRDRDQVVHDLAVAAATAGDQARSASLAGSVADPAMRAAASSAACATAGGDPARAVALADAAEAAARTVAGSTRPAPTSFDPDSFRHAGADIRALVDSLRAGLSDDGDASGRAWDSEVARAFGAAAAASVAIGDAARTARLVRETVAYGGASEMTSVIRMTTYLDRRRDLAAGLARAIDDRFLRAESLLDVVLDLDDAESAAIADEVERLLGTLDESPRRDGLTERLVRTFAPQGRHDRAAGLLDRIADPARRQEATVEVALAMAAAGDPDRAVRLAEGLDGLARDLALGRVAVVAAHEGRPEVADRLPPAIANAAVRAACASAIAVEHAAAGDRERYDAAIAASTAAVEQVSEPDVRRTLLLGLAGALLTEPERREPALARAESAIAGTTDPAVRCRAWLDLAGLSRRAGDSAAARRHLLQAAGTARKMPDAAARALATALVAAAAVQLDRLLGLVFFGDSFGFVRKMTEHDDQLRTAEQVISSAIEAGLTDWAIGRASELPSGIHRDMTTTRIVEALARLDVDAAEQFALGRVDVAERRKVLRTLVAHLCAAGEPARARRLVDLAGYAADRATLVAEVVRHLASDARRGRSAADAYAGARWAVAETLTSSSWPSFLATRAWLSVLPVLARCEPGAVRAGCDQMLALIAREI